MAGQLQIRRMTAADVDAATHISARVAQRAFAALGTEVAYQVWLDHMRPRWDRRVHAADVLPLVAELAGEVIATAFVAVDGHAADLGGAYCAREGVGAGSALVDTRLAWACEHADVDLIRTVIYEASGHLPFWTDRGFAVAAVDEDALFGQKRRLLRLAAPASRVESCRRYQSNRLLTGEQGSATADGGRIRQTFDGARDR